MLSDSTERTVRLRVKIDDGRVTLADGSTFPTVIKEAEAELVLPAESILDVATRAQLTGEMNVRFLPKGHTLFARLQLEGIPSDRRRAVERRKLRSGMHALFVPFELEELLWLTLRTGKRGQLQDCPIRIAALNTSVNSVNEAYTKISGAFETNRRSHAGNVFRVVYIENAVGGPERLEAVRRDIEANPPAAAELQLHG